MLVLALPATFSDLGKLIFRGVTTPGQSVLERFRLQQILKSTEAVWVHPRELSATHLIT